MSKRVLFVIPPGLGDLAANHEGSAGMGALTPEEKVYAYPPHTVAQCAASARDAGWTVSVLDGASATTAAFAASVAQQACEVVAVLVAAGTADADLTFLRILRRHTVSPVLLFGPSAALAAQSWRDEGVADALLAGEPDAAFAFALDAVLSGAAGVLRAEALRPDAYGPSGLLRDLDALPFPAWDLVPWQPYNMVSLLSSRGCPAGCRYCAYVLTQGNAHRAQSVERTLAEWTWLDEEARPPYLVVRDPVFAHNRGRAAAVCEGVAARGLKLGWACESRPEHFDRELIRLMAAAGCATIKIGMESGDRELLARIGRVADPSEGGAYLDQVARVADWCRESGIRCRIFLMAGLPGETPASVEATVAALKRVAPSATIHPNVYRAYDGVALGGYNQPVPPATLQSLREANRPEPPLLKRALGLARRKLLSDSTAPRSDFSVTSEAKRTIFAQPQEKMREQQYLLAGSRVFLTGGSGFVGGYVARALLNAGAEVVALLRPDAPPGALAQLPLQITRGDLTETASWSDALQGCRFCFHVAALYTGNNRAADMVAVNARATGALLAACAEAGVARFIHTSTIGTVGRPSNASLQLADAPDETTPFNLWEQASHYVRSKRLGELIAQAWNGAGLEVIVVKPTAPVGAGDGGAERPPSATGRRILAALRGQPFSYPPGGVNHAPVRDIAAGHLLAAERGKAGETYILGHAQGNLDREAFLRLVHVTQVSNLRSSGSQVRNLRYSGPDALTANPRKAIVELGLPQSDLAAAFAETVAYYRLNMPTEARERVVAP